MVRKLTEAEYKKETLRGARFKIEFFSRQLIVGFGLLQKTVKRQTSTNVLGVYRISDMSTV